MSGQENHEAKVASCCCGRLTASVRGEPVQINMCSCHACQKRSGAAFTYTAFYPEADVLLEGEHRTWRRAGHSGGTHDAYFCLNCASAVMTRLSALPAIVGVAAGCFADSSFAKPNAHYWSSLRCQWVTAGDVPNFDTQ